MFIIPMPPTSSEMDATMANSAPNDLAAALLSSRNLTEVADAEVIKLAGLDMVASHEGRYDLGDCGVHQISPSAWT